jgi:uncharacterized protein
MNRRHFSQKTLLVSGAMALGGMSAANAFAEITTQQNFDFMSQTHPNLALINEFFVAYGKNDLDGIKKVMSADIKWHIPGEHPLSGTKTGVGEVLDFFKKLNKGALKAEPIVMGVNDNYVIDCHKNWSELPGKDAVNFNGMSCLLWRIENNQIVEVHNFPQDQKEINGFFNELYK